MGPLGPGNTIWGWTMVAHVLFSLQLYLTIFHIFALPWTTTCTSLLVHTQRKYITGLGHFAYLFTHCNYLLLFNIPNAVHKPCIAATLMDSCQYVFSNMEDLGWHISEFGGQNEAVGLGGQITQSMLLFFSKTYISSTSLTFSVLNHLWRNLKV